MEHSLREQIALLPFHEDAFFNLIEAPPEVLPLLINAYHTEVDGEARARLVEVIWQFRSQKNLDFLAEALRDGDDRVWKQAMDGIVATGGVEGIAILEAAKDDFSNNEIGLPSKIEWIDEAITQIQSALLSSKTKNERF